jgi:hypothetical protein
MSFLDEVPPDDSLWMRVKILRKLFKFLLLVKGTCLGVKWIWVSRKLPADKKAWIEDAARIRVNWRKFY